MVHKGPAELQGFNRSVAVVPSVNFYKATLMWDINTHL